MASYDKTAPTGSLSHQQIAFQRAELNLSVYCNRAWLIQGKLLLALSVFDKKLGNEMTKINKQDMKAMMKEFKNKK